VDNVKSYIRKQIDTNLSLCAPIPQIVPNR
jgi:hypothetical protein